MQRPIKFRAWDKGANCFYSLGILIDMGGHVLKAGFNKEGYGGISSADNIELMQYTGLKDKNGTEIYEGDIVENKRIEYVVNFEVYWEEDNCQFRLSPFGERQIDKTSLPCFAKFYEVIGNIHENPELLKGE